MAAAKPTGGWVGSAGAGAYDLRSDVMTTPTASMLAAIQNCSLLDDVYQEDPTTLALEAHCAQLSGKEDGVLVLSGTMGNQVALRTLLTQPPQSVLCDHRSHIYGYEAGGVSSLTGAMVTPVVPKNGVYLTLEDVQAHAVLGNDVHSCPTRVISLENTLNGMVMPLAEAQRISAWARQHGILMHCDGARLWEAAAASAGADAQVLGAGSLADYGACFDTISLCFSKGLGAPIGSIVVGSRERMQHARWIRKSIGGGLRQSGVVAAAAQVAVDETFGAGPRGEGGLLLHTHALARQIAELWTGRGGRLVHPVQTNMAWLDLAAAGIDPARMTELARAEGLRMGQGRIVVHYQIYENRDNILPRLDRLFGRLMEEAGKAGAKPSVVPANKSMYARET